MADQRYSVHPSVDYACAIIANLKEKSGRSIEEWIALIGGDGPRELKEQKAWLKAKHGLGSTTARLIVDRAADQGQENTDPEAYLEAAAGYVEAMFDGPKAGLRPLYDALVDGTWRRWPDARLCPCRTMVPVYRDHVIAQIKPTTRRRIDFGLALKGVTRPLAARLHDTGGLAKGDRITHQIRLSDLSEIDDEVWEWLGVAYELDA